MTPCFPLLRQTTMAVIALCIAGCAHPIVTRISGTGVGVASSARLSFLVSEPDAPQIDPAARKALTDRLLAKGYTVVDSGDHLLDFSLSDRVATMGVRGEAPGSWLSNTKAKRPFQPCANRVHRVTLVVVEQASGNIVYRGQAEEYHCKATLQDSVSALVDAVVVNMAKPLGMHVLTRKGRN
jgi:hypothetical protein